MVFSGGRSLLSVALFALLSITPLPALAQNGGINGVVRDADGSPVASATVTARNQSSGAVRSATTSDDGR